MDVLWADAEVESVSFDYDSLRLALTETTGHAVMVEAVGVVGVELVGLWDEIVVERGELIADHPFAQRCWRAVQQRLGEEVHESGSVARNTRSFQTLVVTLIDGAVLQAAAASFTTRREARH